MPDEAWWRFLAWIGWCALWLPLTGLPGAALATGSEVFRVHPGDPRLRFQAALAISDSPVPPGTGAAWQPVTLPDSWRPPARWRQGSQGWYRFTLTGPVPAEAQAVYLWRFSMNAAVWFNGELLGDGGSFDEPVARHWNRPLLVRLPAALWQPEGNVLHVRLRVYPGFGHLMPVAIGPMAALQPDFERRLFEQVTLSQVAFGLTLLTALAGLVLWTVERRDPAPLYFVGVCALWAVYALNTFLRDIPMPAWAWWALVHASVDAFPFFMIAFQHRLHGLRRPRLEAAVGAAALACALFYACASLPQLARWNPLLHALMVLPSLYLLAWLLRRFVQRPALDTALHGLAFLAVLVAGVYDQLLNALLLPDWWRSRYYVLHLTVPLLFLVFVGHLSLRLAQSMRALQALNQDLERRVAAAGREIATTYERQQALLAERGVARERERIYRDLHDSLGARLLSLVHAAGETPQAQAAREALAEMRMLVATSRLPGGALHDLAAEWRLETELRCERAGWQLDWQDGAAAAEGAAPSTGPLLDSRRRYQLEQLLRELVSNALEHSGGDRLTVGLGSTREELSLDVSDNGRGLPAGAAGQGLAGMQQRVADLGGTLQWQPGGGAHARIVLPLPRAPEGPAAHSAPPAEDAR